MTTNFGQKERLGSESNVALRKIITRTFMKWNCMRSCFGKKFFLYPRMALAQISQFQFPKEGKSIVYMVLSYVLHVKLTKLF